VKPVLTAKSCAKRKPLGGRAGLERKLGRRTSK